MDKQKPCYEKRIGNIRVAIWENSAEPKNGNGKAGNGKTRWHNVAITRRYRDSNNEWKETATYNGLGDLAQVGIAVWLAQEWLRERQEEQQPQEAEIAE